MSEKIINQRPSDPDTSVHVSAAASEVVLTLNCFLHQTDIDRLQTKICEFLVNDCKITEDFLTRMQSEREERDKFWSWVNHFKEHAVITMGYIGKITDDQIMEAYNTGKSYIDAAIEFVNKNN